MHFRYSVFHPEPDRITWEAKLDLFRSNPTATVVKSIWDVTDPSISLECQYELISSISNYHKWDLGNDNNGVKFAQRFPDCCRYHPGSPRNKIIQACCFRVDSYKIVKSCFEILQGLDVEVCYRRRKRKRVASLKEIIGVGQEILSENVIISEFCFKCY